MPSYKLEAAVQMNYICPPHHARRSSMPRSTSRWAMTTSATTSKSTVTAAGTLSQLLVHWHSRWYTVAGTGALAQPLVQSLVHWHTLVHCRWYWCTGTALALVHWYIVAGTLSLVYCDCLAEPIFCSSGEFSGAALLALR